MSGLGPTPTWPLPCPAPPLPGPAPAWPHPHGPAPNPPDPCQTPPLPGPAPPGPAPPCPAPPLPGQEADTLGVGVHGEEELPGTLQLQEGEVLPVACGGQQALQRPQRRAAGSGERGSGSGLPGTAFIPALLTETLRCPESRGGGSPDPGSEPRSSGAENAEGASRGQAEGQLGLWWHHGSAEKGFCATPTPGTPPSEATGQPGSSSACRVQWRKYSRHEAGRLNPASPRAPPLPWPRGLDCRTPHRGRSSSQGAVPCPGHMASPGAWGVESRLTPGSKPAL